MDLDRTGRGRDPRERTRSGNEMDVTSKVDHESRGEGAVGSGSDVDELAENEGVLAGFGKGGGGVGARAWGERNETLSGRVWEIYTNAAYESGNVPGSGR